MSVLRLNFHQVVFGNQNQNGGFDLVFFRKDVFFTRRGFGFGNSESSPELLRCTGQKCIHAILVAQAGDFCSRPDATVITNCSMSCAERITRSFLGFWINELAEVIFVEELQKLSGTDNRAHIVSPSMSVVGGNSLDHFHGKTSTRNNYSSYLCARLEQHFTR